MDNLMLATFEDDAFSLEQLTDSINKQPFVPGRIGRLGIFDEDGVYTTSIDLEEYEGTVELVGTVRRGGPPNQNKHNDRKLRTIKIPHIPLSDTVIADSVQNVRAWGGTNLEAVQNVVDMRLKEMALSLDATLEYHRMGAINGTLLDADGSTVLLDLFDAFDVTENTINFQLGNASTDLIGKCTDTAGMIEDELGILGYETAMVFCGKTFWKAFISHAAVKDAYRYYLATGQNVSPLREDLRYKGFVFGGILWEQYRGRVSGVDFIGANTARAFPLGVPGLFKTRFAPADYIETVNTKGLPRYAKQYPTDNSGRGVTLETQSNPINYCTRPGTLIEITNS